MYIHNYYDFLLETYSINSFCKDIPTEFRKEILSWKIIKKSPYSNSYYNTNNKTWDFTEHNSLRISDHWNFVSGGKIHCRTIFPPEEFTWILGKYNENIEKYEILESIPGEYLKLYNYTLKLYKSRKYIHVDNREYKYWVRNNNFKDIVNDGDLFILTKQAFLNPKLDKLPNIITYFKNRKNNVLDYIEYDNTFKNTNDLDGYKWYNVYKLLQKNV